MNKKIVLAGAIFIVIAIVLGAFGAHALKEVLVPEELTSFETGVRYQMYHGLALLAIGLNSNALGFSLKWIFNFILAGVVLFSCSIYGLSLDTLIGMKLSFLGPITPLGGLLMIIGWVILIVQLIKSKK
jgi:uncharacterized membrane protein YgdD (TMEM256/DUF423 family)